MKVLSLNVGRARSIRPGGRPTGIDKQPTDGPVEVRAPGSRAARAGSGLAGDDICDRRHHGGDDQAVYAYAREDLDTWAGALGRPLADGVFGENLTTSGVDVTRAVIGERWQVGDEAVLEVAVPRIPCGVFRTWMSEKAWMRRFNEAGASGAYLRVLTPGLLRRGDPIRIVDRPGHGVDIGLVFRAMTLQPALLPRLLDAGALPDSVLEMARTAVNAHP